MNVFASLAPLRLVNAAGLLASRPVPTKPTQAVSTAVALQYYSRDAAPGVSERCDLWLAKIELGPLTRQCLCSTLKSRSFSSQSVGKAGTATALNSSPNPSTPGQNVTFVATVTGQYGGAVTGTVTFKQGKNKVLGTASVVNGSATSRPCAGAGIR